jgi:hypothetical protein
MKQEKLTYKQQQFARLVSEGQTYADAYRESYPTSKKWKNEAVWVESSKLMTNTNVLLRIQELQNISEERNAASLDQVLAEMRDWLLFDPIDLFDEDSCIKSIHDLPVNVRKSIASFEVVELFSKTERIGKIKRIKLVDKRATAEMYLKKLGAYASKPLIQNDDLESIRNVLRDIL